MVLFNISFFLNKKFDLQFEIAIMHRLLFYVWDIFFFCIFTRNMHLADLQTFAFFTKSCVTMSQNWNYL